MYKGRERHEERGSQTHTETVQCLLPPHNFTVYHIRLLLFFNFTEDTLFSLAERQNSDQMLQKAPDWHSIKFVGNSH